MCVTMLMMVGLGSRASWTVQPYYRATAVADQNQKPCTLMCIRAQAIRHSCTLRRALHMAKYGCSRPGCERRR